VDLDLSEVLVGGVARLGSGRLRDIGVRGPDGRTARSHLHGLGANEVAPVAPSRDYVRILATGLLEAGAWDTGALAAYVASARGAGEWSERAIRHLIG